MYKFLKSAALILLCASLAIPTVLASEFSDVRPYRDAFTDVVSTNWFYPSVAKTYSLGLLQGTSETTFSPQGTVKLCEVITIAARMHSLYSEDGYHFAKIEGADWYTDYVSYATNQQIISPTTFDDYKAIANRGEVVSILAKALPASQYQKINVVTQIPDVHMNNSFATDIYLFYEAGILVGKDKIGTFGSMDQINRAELAAIVSRLAVEGNRLKK